MTGMAQIAAPLNPATASSSSLESSVPSLSRATTLPIGNSSYSTRSHLAPEDALTASPPRKPLPFENGGGMNDAGFDLRPTRLRHKTGSRSRSRRRKRSWKKLLWVKQSYPDNYTDQATFLENLQRNPRLQPYDFWPLVADSTVIVQQVCSVTIFVVCFVGIFQERVSPVSIVGWGTFATAIGWLLWDWWVADEDEDEELQRRNSHRQRVARQPRPDGTTTTGTTPSAMSSVTNLGMTSGTERVASQNNLTALRHNRSTSAVSLVSSTSHLSGNLRNGSTDAIERLTHRPSSPLRSGRTNLRLNTIKSAILIYCTLLGLSPILKSLTRSTSSDSIWAMSFWLLAINIFFYDYSGGVGVKFPASLSTNAALMASTVLASRLPSTGQVFSLTLFSIEVFGLFPVFRRYARHRSFRYHVALTVLLVIGAGGGVGLILGESKHGTWAWKSGLIGVLVGALIAVVTTGGCSWWLIGLQKYKNAINGPWDQARPIIISRRHWDDE